MKFFLGIDSGLTAVKAAVFDERGSKISFAQDKTVLNDDEIDMELMWKKTAVCIKDAVEKAEGADIAAVAVCGHGNGLYAVTSEMKPAFPAITSMTQRTRGELSDSEEMFELTFQNTWEGQPAQILKWLKRNHRQKYDSIYKFMLCKDYINLRLTGKIYSDYTDMSAAGLLDNTKKTYSERIFKLLDIEEMYEKKPDIQQSSRFIGSVTKSAAGETGLAEGTPVCSGAFDVNSCVTGSRAMNSYSIISGTWGVSSALCDRAVKSKDILQCCVFADKEKYICIDSAPTSAVNLEWFLKNVLCNNEPKEADNAVCGTRENNILYLPYIYGFRENKGGVFCGLSAEHTRTDMLKAVYEGICFEHRRNLERIKRVVSEKTEVVLSGGASNSAFWAQMFADVLEIPIRVNVEKQAGVLGCAIMAAVCAGVYDNIYQAADEMVRTEKIYYPQKNYSEKYNKFIKLIEKMKGIE